VLGPHGVVGDLAHQRHVLTGGEARDQVVELEHEADVAATVLRQATVVRGREVLVAVPERAGGRAIEPAEDVQEGRLAAPRRAEKDHELPWGEAHVHRPQRVHTHASHLVDLGDPTGFEERAGRGHRLWISGTRRAASRMRPPPPEGGAGPCRRPPDDGPGCSDSVGSGPCGQGNRGLWYGVPDRLSRGPRGTTVDELQGIGGGRSSHAQDLICHGWRVYPDAPRGVLV